MKMRLFSRKAVRIFLYTCIGISAVSTADAQVYNETFDNRFEISFDEASDFNNYLIDHEHKISYEYRKFLTDFFNSDSLSRAQNLSNRFIKKIDYRLAQLKETPEYDKEILYKAKVYEHFSELKEIFDVDVDTLFALKMKKRDTPHDLIAYVEKMETVFSRLKQNRDDVIAVRKAFYKKYEIVDFEEAMENQKGSKKIDPNDFDEEERFLIYYNDHVDEIEENIMYYEKIYLSYYKIQDLNEKFLHATDSMDTEKMDYYRRAIIHYADIEAKKMENDKGLNEDISFSKACLKTITFYRNTAERVYPKLFPIAEEVAGLIEEYKNPPYDETDMTKEEIAEARLELKKEQRKKDAMSDKVREEIRDKEIIEIKAPLQKIFDQVNDKERKFVIDMLNKGYKLANTSKVKKV